MGGRADVGTAAGCIKGRGTCEARGAIPAAGGDIPAAGGEMLPAGVVVAPSAVSVSRVGVSMSATGRAKAAAIAGCLDWGGAIFTTR